MVVGADQHPSNLGFPFFPVCPYFRYTLSDTLYYRKEQWNVHGSMVSVITASPVSTSGWPREASTARFVSLECFYTVRVRRILCILRTLRTNNILHTCIELQRSSLYGTRQ